MQTSHSISPIIDIRAHSPELHAVVRERTRITNFKSADSQQHINGLNRILDGNTDLEERDGGLMLIAAPAMPTSYRMLEKMQQAAIGVSQDRGEGGSKNSRRLDMGLPSSKTLLMCNFGQALKMTPVLFDVWAGILRTTGPHSALWLFVHSSIGTDQNSIRIFKTRALSEFAMRGVSPSRVFLTTPPQIDHSTLEGIIERYMRTGCERHYVPMN
jgi:hypothetical protein